MEGVTSGHLAQPDRPVMTGRPRFISHSALSISAKVFSGPAETALPEKSEYETRCAQALN
jgi:hypothetical protein